MFETDREKRQEQRLRDAEGKQFNTVVGLGLIIVFLVLMLLRAVV